MPATVPQEVIQVDLGRKKTRMSAIFCQIFSDLDLPLAEWSISLRRLETLSHFLMWSVGPGIESLL